MPYVPAPQSLALRVKMNSDIYEKVLCLAEDIVNASSVDDTKAQWNSYNALLQLCEANEESELDHPLQWEALGDFTNDNTKAVEIYEKALKVAEGYGLIDYCASIQLALAERYLAQGISNKAREYAVLAGSAAKQTKDLDLRREISEFLLNELANT